jgi:hypothetical protein
VKSAKASHSSSAPDQGPYKDELTERSVWGIREYSTALMIPPPNRIIALHRSMLPVTLLIRADEFCIGQHVALHCSLDL